MKKNTIYSYATSLLMVAIIWFGTGYNDIVDLLIFTATWLLITIAGLATLLIVFATIVMNVLDEPITKAQIEQWSEIKKPKLWISIPLTGLWLTALVRAEWTGTTVSYFILSILAWAGSYAMFNTIQTAIKKGENEKDPLSFIKNEEVRDLINKS